MMNFIQNVSMDNIQKGFHCDAGENSMLIQIVDPGHPFPTPFYKFREIRQFEFLDIDEDDGTPHWDFRMHESQGQEIVDALVYAKAHNMNVIVHCHAGKCRSGAVCEIGVIMGFKDTKTPRIPNSHMKRMMMKILGLSYDSLEEDRDLYEYLFNKME